MKLHHKLPLVFAVAAMTLPSIASAGISGLGVGELGGQAGGAATAGVEGLVTNPALSGMIDGGETYLDFGFMYMAPSYTRAGTNAAGQPYAMSSYTTLVPHPAGAVAFHLWKPISLGLSVGAPFGRQAQWPDDGAQRYHLQSVDYKSIFVTPSVGVRATRFLSIGAGPNVVYTTEKLRQRVDLGLTIHEMDPTAEVKPPIEDPFLEGQLDVTHADGVSFGYTVGAVVEPHETLRLGVSYQSPVHVVAQGRSVLVPSMDLAVESHADFTMEWDLPPAVNVGARWTPTPKLAFGAEFQWLGYSVMDKFTIRFQNSELHGSNEELDMLFLTIGGDLGEALDNEKYIARGGQDTWNVKGYASTQLGSRWTLRGTGGYDRHALSDATLNAGNMDFDLYFVGLGLERRINHHWTAYITSTQFLADPRHVTNSQLDPYAPPESGRSALSGNGDYDLFLHRSSVGVKYHWGAER